MLRASEARSRILLPDGWVFISALVSALSDHFHYFPRVWLNPHTYHLPISMLLGWVSSSLEPVALPFRSNLLVDAWKDEEPLPLVSIPEFLPVLHLLLPRP